MKHLLKSVFMKVESSYGVDAAPTTTDVILAENVEVDPLRMETDDYTPVSNKFGKFEKIVGGTWCTVQFDVVVGGGGTPIGALGGVPNHDAVLRAGAMARVINTGTSIVYSPIDSGEESATLTYHVDTSRFRVLGLRGNLEWTWEAGKAPRMRFSGIGLRLPMADFGAGSYGLPSRPRPLAMTKANCVFQHSGGTYDLRVGRMSLNLGNQVEYVNRAHQEEVILSDRESLGSIMFELPAVSAQNFLGADGLCTLATQIPMLVQFGSVAGNRVSWSLPGVQLFNPRLSGDKGTSMLTCDLHVVKNEINVAYF